MFNRIRQRHTFFRGSRVEEKAPFGIKRVIIFFIIISLIALVAASVIYLF